MGRYDIFAQMLAEGKINVDEYARLVNLTANAEERVNNSFSFEAASEIALSREELAKLKAMLSGNADSAELKQLKSMLHGEAGEAVKSTKNK